MNLPGGFWIRARDEGGYRACLATIPGCVIVLKDEERAAKVMIDTLAALQEEADTSAN